MADTVGTQTHFNPIGTLGVDDALTLLCGLVGTTALLLPGIVGAHRTQEIDTGTGQTVAAATIDHQAVIGGSLTQQRNGSGRITLIDVLLQQVEGFGGESGEDIGCMTGEVMCHAATHGKARCIDPFHVYVGYFFDVFDNCLGEGHIVNGPVAGAAGTHVPSVAYAARSASGSHQNETLPVGYAFITRIDFLTAIASEAVEAQYQRYMAICGIAAGHVQVVRTVSAAHVELSLSAAGAGGDQDAG